LVQLVQLEIPLDHTIKLVQLVQLEIPLDHTIKLVQLEITLNHTLNWCN